MWQLHYKFTSWNGRVTIEIGKLYAGFQFLGSPDRIMQQRVINSACTVHQTDVFLCYTLYINIIMAYKTSYVAIALQIH